ncbi:hypothetical protein BS50DRAFT_657962 [Corynespora cassiicola Philippines]|uniref:Glycosyl transferase CAP10 domain-containing protein n=1 Tax=Corynespora cassiicola Philippines TaxID=1448308 RepID=A0A2T2P3A4_CORCC|nr:hypothetical protein BS50DRAFT_657962 [Corynespora cassiicola Philippines]
MATFRNLRHMRAFLAISSFVLIIIFGIHNVTWEFLPERDANSYGLSSTQCISAFSALFGELEQMVWHRKGMGNLTEADIDIGWKEQGAVRAMIYNQKLRILETKFHSAGYDQERALAILHSLDRAITTSPSPLPNIEFSFAVSDVPDEEHANHTIWGLSRLETDREIWLMPDFGYWSWPIGLVGAYEDVRAEITDKQISWDHKQAKLFWRGAAHTNSVRKDLLKATEGKKWADVRDVRWKNRTDVETGSPIPVADHCKYRFLMHTEGYSYSGRGKYLLNCGSVVFMHKWEWIEPHHALLSPSGPLQNFVEVERDFSDLEVKVQELLDDSDLAKSITQHAAYTFRDHYLTPAAQNCYWRRLLRSWAEVSFEPELWEVVDEKKRMRGVLFETFA